MTLQRYTPDHLDGLALRLLDLAATVRKMSINTRMHELGDTVVHDRKALEWIAKLEAWAEKTEAALEVAVRRAKGARRAASFGRPGPSPR